MQIVCPQCAAEYDVPEAVAGPGRSVRCVRCGASWVPVAAAPIPEAPPAAAREPSVRAPNAIDALVRDSPPVRPRRAEPAGLVAAGWVLSIAVLAGAAWLMLADRPAIERAWPPSQRLYAALGLP